LVIKNNSWRWTECQIGSATMLLRNPREREKYRSLCRMKNGDFCHGF
jgi:hypothetical protein